MIPEIYGHGFVAQFRESELGSATQIPEVRFYTQAPQTSGIIFDHDSRNLWTWFCSSISGI
ncbi:MAG: hypothetical protein ABIJ40_19270 [Bacteroidota bacterium]